MLVTGIPHNVHHNGGRLAFGPDGYLYATTGEAQQPALAQDKGSLGGKILRMTTAGRAGSGQPVRHPRLDLRAPQRPGHRVGRRRAALGVGVRRPQRGRAQPHPAGPQLRLAADRGPHDQCRASPGPSRSGARREDSPSGIAIARGSVWMAALRGQRLWRIPLDGAGPPAAPQDFLVGRYGRLRSVLAIGPDTLLVTTSNRDGRQSPGAGDDRILLVKVS